MFCTMKLKILLLRSLLTQPASRQFFFSFFFLFSAVPFEKSLISLTVGLSPYSKKQKDNFACKQTNCLFVFCYTAQCLDHIVIGAVFLFVINEILKGQMVYYVIDRVIYPMPYQSRCTVSDLITGFILFHTGNWRKTSFCQS